MNKFQHRHGFPARFAILLLSALAAGCGGGGSGSGPATGAIAGAPVGAIAPGAVCAVGGVTIPTVTLSAPTAGNQFVTTSTSGVAGGGKLLTVTFSLAMNAATINASTFTLVQVAGPAIVPASVSYNASTRVASFVTAAALLPGISYTGIVSQGAMSAANVSLGCIYAFNFKTGTPAATGLAPVNLGLVAAFGTAATAGVTNTATAPATHINGNVVLDPADTCNAVTVDNVGGFGLCGGFPPTINGSVITPTFPDTTTANAIRADLTAAFLSITPPAGPPAAGSLGGGTPIAAPTGLGAATGSALVPGQNLFFPGVYISTTSILISNDLTLDAQGNADAVFIFQSASTVGTASGSVAVHPRILLINGAKASNVWWQAGTSATLGTNTQFQGNILAAASVTMTLGATSCGRLLAGAFTAGAFVFDSNVVSVPGNASAPPGCI
jgi:hypothetical protein